MTSRILKQSLSCAAIAVLAACGGGGDGGNAKNSKEINASPLAAAEIKGEAVANADTLFDSSGAKDVDGTIVTKSWNYGDGQTGTTDTHIYTTPGTYSATLTVTDDKGATHSKSIVVAVAKCSAAGVGEAAKSALPTVCMQTSRGEIVLEIDEVKAPVSAANFLQYVDEGFYAGTLFHRVSKSNQVVQGGGYTTGLDVKTPTHAPIALESNNGLKNLKYTLGMARTNVLNSATSQFYVNTRDNPGFDYRNAAFPGYAVFGKVISGEATVAALAAVETDAGTEVPKQEQFIRSAVRLP